MMEEVRVLNLLDLLFVPNASMSQAIVNEKDRLRKSAIFLVVLYVNLLASHNYISNWIQNVWVRKLGFLISYCRAV